MKSTFILTCIALLCYMKSIGHTAIARMPTKQGCKWHVWCRDQDETETSEWRDRDEIETLEWQHRDETETSVPLARDDIPRREVQNNVSRRSVETFEPWLCRPISTLLWVCIYFVMMCFNRPQCQWLKQGIEVSGSACAMWYLLFTPNFSSMAVLKCKLLSIKCR